MKKFKVAVAALVVAALFASSTTATAAEQASGSTININTATATELAYLPGVGPSKAEAIIKYRKGHPFKKVEQIMRVKGIGRKSFKTMKPFIRIDGTTTVKKKVKPAKG